MIDPVFTRFSLAIDARCSVNIETRCSLDHTLSNAGLVLVVNDCQAFGCVHVGLATCGKVPTRRECVQALFGT